MTLATSPSPHSEVATSLPHYEDPVKLSPWRRFRRSKRLVVFIVFVAMMLDLIMLTTLEPILPDILYNLGHEEHFFHPPPSVTLRKLPVNRSDVETADARTSKAHQIGLVLATKPGIEILANLVIGIVVDRFGHKYPMVFGCLGNLVATTCFAFGRSLYFLLAARVVQAIGSSLSIVSGLALLASVFPDDKERAQANAIAFAGLSLGMIIGFPFGSICYQFLGKEAPFLILAGLMFIDAALRLLLDVPDSESGVGNTRFMQLVKLITDPYILIGIGLNFIQHCGLGVVIATAPAWMLDYLGAEQWELGVVLVVGAVFQLTAQYITGVLSGRVGRWLFCIFGLLFYGGGLFAYPYCQHIWYVLGPESCARLGMGIMLSVISPLLAYIVDVRHNSNYGPVYGLYAASYNLGLVVGPLCGGHLIKVLSFKWLYQGSAIVLFVYMLPCLLLRRIKGKKVKTKTGQDAHKTSYGTFDSNGNHIKDGIERVNC